MFTMSGPHRLIASFVLLLLLPAAAVVWLGVRLLAQDREIEAAQMEERRKSSADRAVAALEQSLSASERQLPVAVAPGDSDAVILTIRGGMAEAIPPHRLLYYPDPPPVLTDEFAAGEALEFRDHDYAGAATAFERLANSPSKAVRAGALLRMARNLRRLRRSDEAARVYQELEKIEGVSLDGVPADLAARRAMLQVTREPGELERALTADLLAGRWRLDKGTFFAYIGEHPVPPVQEALAEAAAWAARSAEASGRRTLEFAGVPMLVLWQSTGDVRRALIAGPDHQRREWFAALPPEEIVLMDAGGRLAFGTSPGPQSATTRRSIAETGLPWTVIAVNPGDGDAVGFAGRRNMLLAGLALLIVLVFTGGYLTLRAVSRELAVARLQSDFVSSVSHEFRTPLTSLRQFTDLLQQDDTVALEKRRGFYQAQARATERLQRLVESLLDFGRMEAGAHPYKRQPLELGGLVRRVAEEFAREVAPQGFSVETTVAEGTGAVDADPEALTRALWNLLDNAVKYSGESRIVWVDLERSNGGVAIRVRDRGLGIPRAEQAGIFQKFVRGAEARANGIKGTGIGLAMVRHIVEGHRGKVTLESTPGEGSTFTIWLPGKDR